MLWQKYLTQALALQNRAKLLEGAIKFNQIFEQHLLPSQLLHKLDVANQAKVLYMKAHRLCVLLEETKDEDAMVDIMHTKFSIENAINRIKGMIKILDSKARAHGAGSSFESEPNFALETLKRQPPLSKGLSFDQDSNAIDDAGTDKLKLEITQYLKDLSNITSYMEKPMLLQIKKELHRLVNY